MTAPQQATTTAPSLHMDMIISMQSIIAFTKEVMEQTASSRLSPEDMLAYSSKMLAYSEQVISFSAQVINETAKMLPSLVSNHR